MTIKLQPLQIQTMVNPVVRPGKREDGFKPAPSYHIGELEKEELELMIGEYRVAMLEIWETTHEKFK